MGNVRKKRPDHPVSGQRTKGIREPRTREGKDPAAQGHSKENAATEQGRRGMPGKRDQTASSGKSARRKTPRSVQQ